MLQEFIKEWVDLPESSITTLSGEQFARTMKAHDFNEFSKVMGCKSITMAAYAVASVRVDGTKEFIEFALIDLDKVIAVEFRDILIEKVRAYKNSYSEEEENRLENISFENNR